jgi:hypothetical protein
LQATIHPGTAPGRIPSATDPPQRHGRKSESRCFTGYKGAVATDRESQIILDADVLDGGAADATGLLEQVERIEERTGQPVAETLGDCAYGRGESRQAFADACRELIAKVPQEKRNGGLFPKSAFVLDLLNHTVTCPGGQSTGRFQREKDGGKRFSFGSKCRNCPLREQCTTAAGGRSVSVHPQEGMLRAARAYQETAEGRAHLRERVVAEHRLARLGQLGMGKRAIGAEPRPGANCCCCRRSRTCGACGTGCRSKRRSVKERAGSRWRPREAEAESEESPSEERKGVVVENAPILPGGCCECIDRSSRGR